MTVCCARTIIDAGSADIYHAFQATLLPLLPLAPTPASALAHSPWGGLI